MTQWISTIHPIREQNLAHISDILCKSMLPLWAIKRSTFTGQHRRGLVCVLGLTRRDSKTIASGTGKN